MGYVSGYLRTYYPLEFLTTALNINKDKEEKTKALTVYAKKHGITIKSPQFRHSKSGYFFDKNTNTIYKGISSIKFMNENVSNELGDMYEMHFGSFIDVLQSIKQSTTINSRQLEILIKLNFFKEFGSINYLLECYRVFDLLEDKKQMSKEKAMGNNIDFDIIRECSEKETQKTFMGLNWKKLATKLCEDIANKEDEFKDIIDYQMECLGYVDIIDKKFAGYCVSTEINVEHSPKIKLYALANGNTIPVKIKKDVFKNNPIKRGDIVRVLNQHKDFKSKYVNKKWVKSTEKEWWVDKYEIV